MRKIRFRKQSKNLDKGLLFLTLILTGLGLIAVADASAPIAASSFDDRFYFFKQQAVWAGIGVILLFLFSKVKYTLWEKVATPLFGLAIILLILVLVPSLGVKVYGARRWFLLGPISFQPSEFVKMALAVYLAKVASKNMRPLAYFIPLFLAVALIMMQPDLGTAIVVMVLAMSEIFVSGLSLAYFLGAICLSAIVSLVLILTSSYRKERFLTYLAQTQDPLGKAYHIGQILIALGAGGFWGVGLGASRQKYLFLPESATDSIFAVIAEEVGFFGVSILIVIFTLFVLKGLAVAKNAPDRFSQVLAVGLITWIGIQTILNLTSMVALTPLTGIPLPFFSYGGSSLTTVLAACGIVLNISRYGEKAR